MPLLNNARLNVMAYAPGQNYQLRYALAMALLLHGLILFGITVNNAVNPPSTPADMEVTVTLSAASTRPEQAENIAQADQLASGDHLETQQNESLPRALLFEQTSADQSLNITSSPDQQLLLQDTSYRIITTILQSNWQIGHREINANATIEQALLDDQEKTLNDLAIAVARLETRLFSQRQPKNKKPRTLLVTSSSAIAHENAAYIKQWRDRVETIGNLYYPQEARDQKLYGDVRLLVSVMASGVVDKISILASSGNKILDNAAIESIHLASPFEPFPASVAANYDRIDVIRTWQFRKDRVYSKAN